MYAFGVYRTRVSTDTKLTDALSTHDPKILPFSHEKAFRDFLTENFAVEWFHCRAIKK